MLPDYDPDWGYYRQGSGAPVDEEGKPVYHHVPESFEKAATDGQRWRWCLEQAMEFDTRRTNDVMRVVLGLLRSCTQTTAPLLDSTYYPFPPHWNRSRYLHFASGTPDEHASKDHC